MWSGEEKQLINQPITEPKTEIDITHMPSGIYFVKVVDDKKVWIGKVVVKR